MSELHIVVGGGSGIGRLLVELMLKHSEAGVLLVDRGTTPALPTPRDRVRWLEADVSQEIDWKASLPADCRIKSLCFLVPACRPRDATVNELGFTPNFIANIGAVNAGLLRLLFAATPYFADGSTVVLVSSVLGDRVAVADATLDYHASKAVLESIARYMTVRLSPKVMVNCLSPGLIARDARSALITDAATADAVGRATPLGRAYRQEEIARAIWALASGSLGRITGQTIAMDGGSSVLEPFSVARRTRQD
jgi:NAD(P)-dependent dehydrogenase (short-subunit alcohol dehydrogenase family)